MIERREIPQRGPSKILCAETAGWGGRHLKKKSDYFFFGFTHCKDTPEHPRLLLA